jgi:bis(5'-nucleosyl)-tetraphosphatase (symmetrical)
LVARGENSVGALRFIKKLADRGAAATVLGNHDLTLLAVLVA